MNTTNLVSPCGLYCGACSKYLKNQCGDCAENHKASWCKIITCTKEKGYQIQMAEKNIPVVKR